VTPQSKKSNLDGTSYENNKQSVSNLSPSFPSEVKRANNQEVATTSSFSPPSLSLPRGGGAIRGIGEKFSANTVTGSASFSIPIYTSPGRSGFGPQLSLSYDSGSGNGPFGFGWSLSLPSITRKTDKGLPKYQDALETDVFILSGSEDLVPQFKKNEDGSWANDTEGNHVIDEVEREGYIVRSYRPRIEGLFARIERWTRLTNGDIHWRSISKDNILTVYGRDEKSRIVDPSDSSKIFSWLICESYDDKGNAMKYDYTSEDNNGIDLSQVNEHNRQHTAQKYIKRILYGNKEPLLIDATLPSFRKSHVEPVVDFSSSGGWMFEVVFDYGEGHYEVLPLLDDDLSEQEQHRYAKASAASPGDDDDTSIRRWSSRPDPFSSYRSGFEIRTYRRCHRVLMFHNFPELELGGEPYLVRSTEFDYSDLDYNNFQENGLSVPPPVKTELEHDGSTRLASFITNVTQSGYVRDETTRSPEVIDGIVYHIYLKKSLPPVEFDYSKPSVHEEVEEIDEESLENLPIGLDGGGTYQWTDLDGEGISGILARYDGGWYYKRNEGGARFGPLEKVVSVPSMAGGSSGTSGSGDNNNNSDIRFLDLAADGKLDSVILGGSVEGFYERQVGSPYGKRGKGWQNFRPFLSIPNLNWQDQNLRLVDLTGDGHSDILLTKEDGAFTWHLSLAEEGFGEAEKVAQSLDEEHGPPRLVFNDGTQSIFLADMSGDGLSDLVRIRNGEVCYWPNLGYGRFGDKVTMDNSPWFDIPDLFRPSHIQLADIDGTGVTDILYFSGDDGVKIYFNQSGNRWSDAYSISSFASIDDSGLSQVQVLDLLGTGTACIVWSSSLPSNSAGRQMRYIDLMDSKKPHLIVSSTNNLGAETYVHYSPSTKFYLADKLAGKPWITRLPFPVHVVERVEVRDRISKNIFVTKYMYHHGYFDGKEREFRGFGRVDQWDTEQFGALISEEEFLAADNIDIASHVPPVETRTWFHTGIYIGRNHVSNFFAGLLDENDRGEYYREPQFENNDEEAGKYILNDTIMPPGLTVEEEREACRALKGKMLRQEVYALDGSEKEKHPYTVIEQNFSIRTLQPEGSNRHGVFLAHGRETISYQYERNLLPVLDGRIVDESSPDMANANIKWLPDPRISHSLTLEVDNYGNILKQAAIGYGRLLQLPANTNPDLLENLEGQRRTLVTYSQNRFTNAVIKDDSYRAPLPCESRTYELYTNKDDPTKYLQSGPAGRFVHSDFVEPDPDSADGSFRHVFDRSLNYEDEPTNGKERRLIEQVRTIYRKNDLTDLLPVGELEPLALPGDSYKLAFTPGLLSEIYQRPQGPGQPPENLLPDHAAVLGGQGGDRGGYVRSQELKVSGHFPDTDPDDHWWVPSSKIFYSENDTDTAAEELAHAVEHFFTPRRNLDSFGTFTFLTLDEYDLMTVETRDSLDNRVTAGERDDDDPNVLVIKGNDYRTLQPGLIMDPNRNRAAVTFDALGMVVATAVMGKPPADTDTIPVEGDSLADFGFNDANLTEDAILRHLEEEPPSDPHAILKHATTRLVYDLFAYDRTREQSEPKPALVYTIVREIHDSEPGGPQTRLQHSFSYSDGFGREIQRKIQAEPGPLDLDDPNSPVIDPRWVGSGWTIYNNKAKPVRKYEPYFSDTHDFEFRHIVGVSQVLFYDSVGRVVATLYPNHSYEKIVFDPWHQETWDVNDTVLLSPDSDEDVKRFFLQDDAEGTSRLPVDLYLPTWRDLRMDPAFDTEANERWPNISIRNAEKQSAEKTEVHANTPTTAYFDSLGRTFLTVAHNKWINSFVNPSETFEEKYSTRINLDIEGNQREVKDAIGRIVMLYGYDMLGNRIKQESMDAGRRWMLNDVAGNSLFLWNSRGHTISTSYDQLRRPLEVRLQSSDPAVNKRVELYIYGESEGHEHNHRGKVFRHFDEAGLVTNVRYDFKGNLLESNRRLATNYKETPDWPSSDPEMSELEDETFSSSTAYDALNRPIRLITPDDSTTHYFYNESSLLEHVEVNLNGATVSTAVVQDIDYNAKGERVLIEYGNGVVTKYVYDNETFRLIHMATLRGNELLQDLSYISDPAGNIIHIQDDADIQNTIFFHNHRVEPSADYSYDALYRLIEASGREHLGLTDTGARRPPSPTTYTDEPRVNLGHPNDSNLMENYLERYSYDSVGNILQMEHEGGDPSLPGWTRSYNYNETSFLEADKLNNQLSSTEVNSETEEYSYDAHGNMTEMPHLPIMRWNFRDELQASSKQHITNGGTSETTYYVYNHVGQRVRKATELQAGEGETARRKDERIYAGNFEIYRRYGGDGIDIALERETLHVSDSNNQRIAIMDTRTRGDDDDECPSQSIRYQFNNHLGSSSLELDEEANIINYEEYYPYGSTSYHAGRNMCELSLRRYRYVGKERDEETGLYYYGVRYYAPWLGRWIATDPAGLVDGLNVYSYSRDNPLNHTDPSGMATDVSDPVLDLSEVRGYEPDTGKLKRTVTVQVEDQFERMDRQAALPPGTSRSIHNFNAALMRQGRQEAVARINNRVQETFEAAERQELQRAEATILGSKEMIKASVKTALRGTGPGNLALSAYEVYEELKQGDIAGAAEKAIEATMDLATDKIAKAIAIIRSKKLYNVAPHGKQPKPKGGLLESHHLESQERAKESIAGYNPKEDPTILVTERQHRKIINPMQRKEMNKPDYSENLGRADSLEASARQLEAAGVPRNEMVEAIIKHSNYLFGLTPLQAVQKALPKSK
jgi:RHS repeat-associated protein